MAEKCDWWRVDCQVKQGVENVVTDGLSGIARNWLDTASGIIEFVGGWWLKAPAVSADSKAVFNIQESLWWYTGAIGILGILIALGRMVLSQDFKTLTSAAKPIVNIILVTGAYTAGIAGLSKAGDALAEWIMDRAANTDSSSKGLDSLGTAIVISTANPQGMAQHVGTFLIIGLISLIGSIVLFGFMIFRDVMLLVMLAFLPSIAAATGSETGDQAFRKANGWLVALLLFKPVAATIFALGLTLMKDNSSFSGDEGTVMKALSGVVVILLASLSLPSLVKFVVPAAAAGSTGFSGGGAIGGAVTVAAGAAVLSGIGTGGGAAAGAGAGARQQASNQTASNAPSGSTAAASGGKSTESAHVANTPPGAQKDTASSSASGSPSGTKHDDPQTSSATQQSSNSPGGEQQPGGGQTGDYSTASGASPSGAGRFAEQLPNMMPGGSRMNDSIEGDDGQ